MAPAGARRRMAEELVAGCDVLLGPPDETVLEARERLGSGVPLVCLAHPSLAWGGRQLRPHLARLTTRDVLLVGCAAEVEIAALLVPDARVRVAPPTYDAGALYPLDEEERRAARARLRIAPDDRVVLYAGPLAAERGVHWLLAVFDAVAGRVPGARLVLAGSVAQPRLTPFGVAPVAFHHTLARLLSEVERPDRVQVVAPSGAAHLRELYGAADVTLDLTLHPDENAGLAEVESLACGTPVVCTSWGGLRDAVAEGVAGHRVSTTSTPSGVKLSWWEAVNRLASLLEDGPGRAALRAACAREAGRFTQAAFSAILQNVLSETIRTPDRPAGPLRPSAFAQELWSACDPEAPGAPFGRGGRSRALHRALLAPFTAPSPAHVAAGEALEPGQVVTLATPLGAAGPSGLRPADVLYALEVEVPPGHAAAVGAILARMRERPAAAAGELAALPVPGVPEALGWMLGAGLLLRTRQLPGWPAPETAPARMARPSFVLREVDRAATDLLVRGA
jgi:glycosyltransferase involved in cell wall biosynthesis